MRAMLTGSVASGLAVLLFCAATGNAQTLQQVTLTRAIDMAMQSHYELKAARTRTEGTQGLMRQAGVRPNPGISLQSENWRFSSVPSFRPGQELDAYALVSQTFETGGKRAQRIALAQWDLKIAELEYKAVAWRIRQEVRQAFFRALSAQKQLEIIRESGRYFEEIVEYHRVRVEQGAMAEADLVRVRLERERLNLAENSAAVEAERNRVELLRAMGVSDYGADFGLVDEASPPPSGATLDLKSLLSLAREKRLEVTVSQAQVDRARAQVDAQRALAKPDWTMLFGYKRTTGYDTVLAGVSVPIPIFNKNTGNILFSRSEVIRAQFLLNATLSRLEADIAGALVGIRRNRAMLSQMEKGMLERAEQSLRISLAAYQVGGADLLRLLDAQRVRNEVQLLFTRTQVDYRLSLADLENAVGQEDLPLSEELLSVQP